jgi:hypothetical protein
MAYYGDDDDNAYSAFDDPDETTSEDSTDYYGGDDEIDEDVLGDFALPEEDLNGLHVVDENGEEPVEKVSDVHEDAGSDEDEE